MDQNRLVLFNSVFDEIKYSFCRCVFRIENNLVLKVEPLESEVHYSSAFEMVLNLLAGTVDDMRYFVGYNEFLVLYELSEGTLYLPELQSCLR